ncbi:MAG: FkbM family methyltransferase [Halieaceae bacterium]|nr:FkbM family methyltransferase [Halieaceae bacterium]
MTSGERFYNFLWNRRWVPRRLLRHLYKRLARSGVAPDIPFATDFFGLRYQGNLNNNIDFNIYFYGAFEKPLLFFLRDARNRLRVEKPVFVDIGANVGQHSLFMSAHGMQVHAFEPFARVREQFMRQVQANRLDNVRVHPVGLSNENTRSKFFAPTGTNAGIGSFDANSVDKGNVNIGELQLARGDDYFPRHGIDRIDLLKIDVEGYEKRVLEGLRKSLERERPIIVCEITLGNSLSFATVEELREYLPSDYLLFTFARRKADGSKARRRNARDRYSGHYRLTPLGRLRSSGQDDIIACPLEKESLLPQENLPADRQDRRDAS